MPMKVRYTSVNGEIIAENRGGVRKLYLSDPLGSTLALADNTQTITDRFTYWPYGEGASRTGTTPTPFRYVGTQGYRRDKFNSIYVRARHFGPDIARWRQKDPLFPSEPAYAYAHDSPVYIADPSGMQNPRYPPLPPSPGNCQVYKDLCQKGYVFGCNSWYACLGFGNSPGANCVRRCLQDRLKRMMGARPHPSCDQWVSDHLTCFGKGREGCNYPAGGCTNPTTLRILCRNLITPVTGCVAFLRRFCGWPSPPETGITPGNGAWICLDDRGWSYCHAAWQPPTTLPTIITGGLAGVVAGPLGPILAIELIGGNYVAGQLCDCLHVTGPGKT